MLGRICAASLVLAFAAGALAAADDPAPASTALPPLPERFNANVFVINGPVTGTARLRIVIERWTTDQERTTFVEALKSGGTDGLTKAMTEVEVGYLQVNNNLRWPLSTAATWMGAKGRMIRVATSRPIYFQEAANNTRSMDYPIGFIEFSVPAEGPGEGQLVAAIRASFDDQGRLQVQSTPQNTGPQKVGNVLPEVVKPKKEKKPKP